jgi:hypothetical protein
MKIFLIRIKILIFSNNRANHSSTNDLVISSTDHTQLINSSQNNRAGSLALASKSNEHSPRHHTSLLTPTNHEQSRTRRCFSSKDCF